MASVSFFKKGKKDISKIAEDYIRKYNKKTSKKFFHLISLLLVGFLLLVAASIFAQDKSEDPVEVAGYIVDQSNKKMKDVAIRLYRGNEIVKEMKSKRGKFNLTLQPGEYYTVEMNKDGFEAKRIAINTFIPKNTYVLEPFQFVMEMLPESSVKDAFVMDFPVALVRFYKGKGRFDFIPEYTNAIRAEREVAFKEQ